MIGTRTEARFISQNGWDYNSPPPAGWKEVGSGGSRTAFLAPSGVVYKLGDNEANRNEIEQARRWRGNKKLAEQDVYIPTTSLYDIDGEAVIAMQYIESAVKTNCSLCSYYTKPKGCTCRTWGTPRPCFAWMYDYLEDLGLCDMFYDNLFYSTDRKFYIIDLGSEI